MRLRSTHNDAVSREPATHGPTAPARPLGTVLRDSGQISQSQLDKIVRSQEGSGRLFGEIAIDMGFVTQAQIDRAIAEQQEFYLLDESDPRLDPAIVAAFRPHDPLANAARDLRRSIATSTMGDGRSVRSVAILGIAASTEASLLAANLAVCCAQAGYRTLLVDANLDEPVQHGLFRVPNRVGVSSFHSRPTTLQDMIQATAIPSLSLLSAGPAVPNSLELLERERLFSRLDKIEAMFDVVLVDASQARPDAVGVFDGAEGAVIVVRQHGSSMRDFRTMVDSLDGVSVATLGSIFVE